MHFENLTNCTFTWALMKKVKIIIKNILNDIYFLKGNSIRYKMTKIYYGGHKKKQDYIK